MNYKIFIINLDRSKERFQHALTQLAPWPNLPIERVSAADGRAMSEQELNQYYSLALNKAHYHKLLKPGEKGCYISHIWCWQKIVEQKLDFALILEDDFIIQTDLHALLDTIAALSTPWHYLKLAMPNKQQPVLKTEVLSNGFSLVHYKKHPVSTVAQAIDQAGAQLLLSKAVPFYRPVDVMLQYHFELNIEAIGIQPLPFRPEHSFDSDIYSKDKSGQNRQLFFRNRICYVFRNFFYNCQRYGVFNTLTAKRHQS